MRFPGIQLVEQAEQKVFAFETVLSSRERPKSALHLRLKKREAFKIANGGTFWGFFTFILLQNIETTEGWALCYNPKTFKKTLSAEKNSK